METETIFKIIVPVMIVAFAAHRGYHVRKHGKEESTLKKREDCRHPRSGGICDCHYLCHRFELALMGIFAVPSLVALDRCWHCFAGICFAPVGTKYAWQKLERYAAHDSRTSADYNWTLSIHQTPDLHSVPSYSRLHTFYFSQLVCWHGMDRHDHTRSCITHWL